MIVHDLIHDLQLYSIDHIGKVTSKALEAGFEAPMIPLALTGGGVAAVLNRVCIALNKLPIMSQSHVIKVMKEP